MAHETEKVYLCCIDDKPCRGICRKLHLNYELYDKVFKCPAAYEKKQKNKKEESK